jgi:hypothetical protein
MVNRYGRIVDKQALLPNIRDVSKKYGEWYQKRNKTEDINKLTLLA